MKKKKKYNYNLKCIWLEIYLSSLGKKESDFKSFIKLNYPEYEDRLFGGE